MKKQTNKQTYFWLYSSSKFKIVHIPTWAELFGTELNWNGWGARGYDWSGRALLCSGWQTFQFLTIEQFTHSLLSVQTKKLCCAVKWSWVVTWNFLPLFCVKLGGGTSFGNWSWDGGIKYCWSNPWCKHAKSIIIIIIIITTTTVTRHTNVKKICDITH